MTTLSSHVGDAPKSNGVILIVAGVLIGLFFLKFAYPALKAHRVHGGPKGRLMVAGPAAVAFIVVGVVLLFIGH